MVTHGHWLLIGRFTYYWLAVEWHAKHGTLVHHLTVSWPVTVKVYILTSEKQDDVMLQCSHWFPAMRQWPTCNCYGHTLVTSAVDYHTLQVHLWSCNHASKPPIIELTNEERDDWCFRYLISRVKHWMLSNLHCARRWYKWLRWGTSTPCACIRRWAINTFNFINLFYVDLHPKV